MFEIYRRAADAHSLRGRVRRIAWNAKVPDDKEILRNVPEGTSTWFKCTSQLGYEPPSTVLVEEVISLTSQDVADSKDKKPTRKPVDRTARKKSLGNKLESEKSPPTGKKLHFSKDVITGMEDFPESAEVSKRTAEDWKDSDKDAKAKHRTKRCREHEASLGVHRRLELSNEGFWEFLFSNRWDEKCLLRVLDGDLLKNLLTALYLLEKDCDVISYVTIAYIKNEKTVLPCIYPASDEQVEYSMKKVLVELDYFTLRPKDMDAAASTPSTEGTAFTPQPMDSVDRAAGIVPSREDITKTEISKDILPTIVTIDESLGSECADDTIDSADHKKESIKALSVGHTKQTMKTLLADPTKQSTKRPKKRPKVKIMDTKVVFVTQALDDTKQAGHEATITGYNVAEKNVNESAKAAAAKGKDKSPAAKDKASAAKGKTSAAKGKGLGAKGKTGKSASVTPVSEEPASNETASDDSEPPFLTLLDEEDSPEASVTDVSALDIQPSSSKEEVFHSQSLELPVLTRCNIRGITRPPPHITCFMPYHMVREPLLQRLRKHSTGFPPLVMLKKDPVEEPKVPELGISVSKRDLGFPGPREDDGSELVATEPFLEPISSKTEIPKGKAIIFPVNLETKGKKPKKGPEDKFSSLEYLDFQAEEKKIYSSTIDAVKLKKFQKDLELMASDLTAVKQLQKDTVDIKSRLEEQLYCRQRDPSLRQRFDFQTNEHTKKLWGQVSDEELYLIRQLAQCLSLTEFCAYINERKLRPTNPIAWKLLQKQDKLQDKFQDDLKGFTSKQNWECEQPDTFQLKDTFDYYSDDSRFPLLKHWDKCPTFHDFLAYMKEDTVAVLAKKKRELLKKQQEEKQMKAAAKAAYKTEREKTGVESDRSVVSSSEEEGRSRDSSTKTRDGSARRRESGDKTRDGSARRRGSSAKSRGDSTLTKGDEKESKEKDEKDKFKEKEHIVKGKQSKEKDKELKEKDNESKKKDKKSKGKGKQSKGKDKELKRDESKGRDSGSWERKEKGMRDQHKEAKQKAMARREQAKPRQSLERTKKQKDKKGSHKAKHKSREKSKKLVKGTKAGKAAKAAKKMMMEELGDNELAKARSEIGVTFSGTHLLTEEQETLFREARLFLRPDCPWHVSVRFAYLVGGVCDSVGMRTGLLKRRANIYGLLEEIKTILKMNESLLYRENLERSGSYEEISLKSSSSESLPKPKPSEIKPVEHQKEEEKKGHKKSKPPLKEPEIQSTPEAKTKKKKKAHGKESGRSKSGESTDSELDKRESSKDKHTKRKSGESTDSELDKRESSKGKHTKRKSDSDDRAKIKHRKKDKQTLDGKAADDVESDTDQRESSKDKHAKQKSDRDDIAKKKQGKKDREKVAEDVESDKNQRESRQDKHAKQKSDSDDHVKKKHRKKDRQSLDEEEAGGSDMESGEDQRESYKDTHAKKKHIKKDKQRVDEKVAEADDTFDEVLLSEEEAEGEKAFSKKGMWKKTVFKTNMAQKLLGKKSIPSESSDEEPTTEDRLEAKGGEPPSKGIWKKAKLKMLPKKDEKPDDKELVGTDEDTHKEGLTKKFLGALLSGKKVSKVIEEEEQEKKDEQTEKTEDDAASTQALDTKSELEDDLGLHVLKRRQLRSLFSKEFKAMLFDEMFETSSSDSTVSLDFDKNFDIKQLKKSYSLDNYLASKDSQLLDGRKYRTLLPKSKKMSVARSKIKLIQSQKSKISVNITDYLAAHDLESDFTLRERSPVKASHPPMILGKMREFSFLKYRDYVSGTLNVEQKTEHAISLEEVCRRLARAMNVFVVRKERATTTQPFQSKVSITFTRRESKIASDTLLLADANQIVANVCDTLNGNY